MTQTIIAAVLGSSLLTTLINRLFDRLDKKSKAQSAEGHALQLLLYSDIRRSCLEAIKEKSIDPEELEVLTKKWECYHNELNGNGYLDSLMSAVRKLPIEEERYE